MRSTYLDHATWAIADLSEVEPGVWELHRIRVPDRHCGRGVGRALMGEVLADADRDGVTVELHVNPYGLLDRDALVAWYERLGFRSSDDVRWRREPRALVTPGAPGGRRVGQEG